MSLTYGSFVASKAYANDFLFQKGAEWDNRNDMFLELRSNLNEHGFELHTPDVLRKMGVAPSFEVHLNVRRETPRNPAFVILLENPYIRRLNNDTRRLSRYHRVFSWKTNVLSSNWTQIGGFPVTLPSTAPVDGYSRRPHLSCMIASNKSCDAPRSLNLYKKRIETIRWFESHAANEFHLYGTGWDRPESARGFPKLLQKIDHLMRPQRKVPFPAWKGAVSSKHATMLAYRFAFCYENVADLPGYATEKIVDAMVAGCIPIYWGAPDIKELVPADCFIDRREFLDHQELLGYLECMTESEFILKQKRINEFLKSSLAHRFDSRHFGLTVARQIIEDLKQKTD